MPSVGMYTVASIGMYTVASIGMYTVASIGRYTVASIRRDIGWFLQNYPSFSQKLLIVSRKQLSISPKTTH